MADHRKFLQLLAKEINHGQVKFSFESLKTYLLESIVEVLPDGHLKDDLLKKSQENTEYLWKLVKPANKYSEIQFNIFNQNGLEETLKNISETQSFKEQVHYLSQAALCHPCPKVFELLLNAQKKESSDQSQLDGLSKVTELYGRLSVDCQNFEVLHGLMQVFLSEIDKINDKFKSSNEAQESWLNFKDTIHRFLVHCHVKRTTLKAYENCDITSTGQTQYGDLLAAVIAIYIDVIIAIGQINEDVNNHLSNMVYLLLGDSPSHILDAANQIFTLDSNTVRIIFPFLRKVFDTTRTCTTECANYIKYVRLAWKVQNCVRKMEEEALYLKKTVCSLLPPENFLTWLTDVDSSLIKDLELSGLVRHKITDKILQCGDEENIERLLDLASTSGEQNQTTEELLDHNNEEDKMDESEANTSLFFVDAQGSSELVEQCQEQESTSGRNEKMLKMQINVLLEKLDKTGSEDDNDDFDDNEPETTFDFGNAESKNCDDMVSEHTQGVSEGEQGINVTTTREEGSLAQSGEKRKRKKISNILRNLRRRNETPK